MRVREKSRGFRIFFNIIFWTVFAAVGIVIIVAVADRNDQYKHPLFGYRVTVIVTPSMATVNDANKDYITDKMERVYVNDLITAKEYNSYDDIKIYDIATYYNGHDLICHRVINKYVDENNVQYIVLRGDANNADDTPVKYSQMRGKVVSINHTFGPFVLFLQGTWGKIVVFGVLALLYLLSFLIH